MTGHFPHQAVKLVAGDGYLERHHVADVLRDALASGHVQAFTREELGLILFWAEELEYEQSKPARKAHRYLDAMGENDG